MATVTTSRELTLGTACTAGDLRELIQDLPGEHPVTITSTTIVADRPWESNKNTITLKIVEK